MKTVMSAALIAATSMVAVPALAQGVYVGPGGVGVDLYRHHHDYDRDRYDRGRDRGYYEGRSAYRDDYAPRYRDGY